MRDILTDLDLLAHRPFLPGTGVVYGQDGNQDTEGSDSHLRKRVRGLVKSFLTEAPWRTNVMKFWRRNGAPRYAHLEHHTKVFSSPPLPHSLPTPPPLRVLPYFFAHHGPPTLRSDKTKGIYIDERGPGPDNFMDLTEYHKDWLQLLQARAPPPLQCIF